MRSIFLETNCSSEINIKRIVETLQQSSQVDDDNILGCFTKGFI